ncbi:MAG: hypothetical protein WAN65_31980 [Candidatus Sulfotelmatobacter sp.]
MDSGEDVPNEETLAAMLDARNGNVQLFDSVSDLMAELKTDDPS